MESLRKENNDLDALFSERLKQHEADIPTGLASWNRMSAIMEAKESKASTTTFTQRALLISMATAAMLLIVGGVYFYQGSNSKQTSIAVVNDGDEIKLKAKTGQSTTSDSSAINKANVTKAPLNSPSSNFKKTEGKKTTRLSPAKALTKGIYLAKVNSEIETPVYENASNVLLHEIAQHLAQEFSPSQRPFTQSMSNQSLDFNLPAVAALPSYNDPDTSIAVSVSFIEGKEVAIKPKRKFFQFLKRLWNIKEGKESISLPTERLYAIFGQEVEESTSNEQ